MFLDIYGKVVSEPVKDVNSALQKLTVVLCNDDLTQEVDLLGEHANSRVHVGDIVALGGVRVSKYREQRMLQTTFLTVVEINPTRRPNQAFDINCTAGEPKRKALKLSFPATKTVLHVQELKAGILQDPPTVLPPAQEVTLVGHLQKLSQEFFDADVPIIEGNKKELMCWQTNLRDSTGSVQVKVWDKACYQLFAVTASGFRDLWEKGVEDVTTQEEVLDQLNTYLDQKVSCCCTVVARKYGKDGSLLDVQINVNNLEVHATE